MDVAVGAVQRMNPPVYLYAVGGGKRPIPSPTASLVSVIYGQATNGLLLQDECSVGVDMWGM